MFTVVGEALVDLVGRPPRFTAFAGGSPFNVAVSLARLGQPVALVARTGRDGFGRMLEDKARASGVSFDRWQVVDEPTTLAVATLDEDGSAQYDFYLDATAGLGWGDEVLDLVPKGGVLHLGSLSSWRMPSDGPLQALQRDAYASGRTLVSYDPNVRPALIEDRRAVLVSIERCVSAAHVVKASDEDVAYLYPELALEAVARRWCSLGASLVVLTLGRSGAVAFREDGEIARRPGLSIALADTVGAGDSFMGGLLAALGEISPEELPGADVDAALAQAVAVSAMTCERNGADPPTRAELDERLRA